MDGTGGHHVKQNKLDAERQVLHIFSCIWKLGKKVFSLSTSEYYIIFSNPIVSIACNFIN
jgi:hypothetical protein